MPSTSERTRLRRGRLLRAAVAVALAAGGCESWKSAKNDNPVLGPPPPRLSWNESPQTGVAVADASGEAGVVRVSLSEPGPLTDFSLIAIVNGEPVVAGELLAPYEAHFVKALAKAEAEGAVERATRELEMVKKEVIKRTLDKRIEQILLVQALKLMLKAEQWKQTEEKLNEAVKSELRKLMEKEGVNSRAELEQRMAAEGASLAEYQQAFKVNQLSQLYLSFKTSDTATVVGRQDILDYYNANLAKYEHTPRARFQLLMVSFAGAGGEAKAQAKLDAALAELGRGDPFPDVVKRHSNHPTAAKGGQHDWIKPGDFSAREVEDAIFSLPANQVSEVFTTKTPPAFMVVRVTEREPAGRTPLAEVQNEIDETLKKEARQKKVEDLLAKLHETAVVTKYVD